MKALGFLYIHSLKNNFRKSLHRPLLYIYLAIGVAYIIMVPTSFRKLAEGFGLNSPEGMATVLTMFAIWVVPSNLIAYAKRKGLLYRSSDIHFLFPSPTAPKQILLYAHLKGIIMHVFLNLFVIYCGGVIFYVEGWRLALYYVFAVFAENVTEGSIMLILYGTERLSEKQRDMVVRAAYGLGIILAVLAVFVYLREGLSKESILHFLNGNLIQLVPVVGWYIAVIHLLCMGATTVNMIGSALYFLFSVAMVVAAVRMKCTGAFYEDAVRFAEDYEDVLESRRQGDMSRRIGKKRRLNKAKAIWRGRGAQLLFYRQLLEYRKSRHFIFDINTVFAAAAGAAIAWLYVREDGFGAFTPYVIPSVSAYLIYCFTGFGGKWAKELKSPYTYLLPDSPWKKLWYATAMQHVQGFVNGCLVTLPGAVVMKMEPIVAVFCIIFYMAFSANKLYALAVAEAFSSGVLGSTGKRLFQVFIQSVVIGFAVMGEIVGILSGDKILAYALMDFFLIAATLIFMVLAALNFYRMETV